MTTHAVGSVSAVPVLSKGAPKGAPQSPAGAFEHQLHAAVRQHSSPAAQAPADAHDARTERGRDPALDQRGESSSSGPDARDAQDGKTGLDSNRAKPSGTSDPASTSPASSAAHAPAPSAVSTAADTVAGTVSSEATMVEKKDVEGDEQDAAALVGAMLALIGPATGKVLTLGAAGGAAMSAKSVAADAAAAAMLQATDVVTMATPASMASTSLPVQLVTAEALSLDLKNGPDASTRVVAAPALMLSPSTIAAPAAPVSVPISAPVGSHGFAPELGQQVAWFVGQDIKQARIRLHPEELGSLDLKISVSHGRVDVVFHAQHPGAVTAVQQSLPQLGQMLAQHGLSLGNAEVGQHDRGDQSGHSGSGNSVSETDEIHGPSLPMPLIQLGLLDAFA